MGKPAARALIDKGAHSGLIQTGSPNVIIGGFPAARKTDGLSCKEHGQGIIVGGSGTVLVNGLPLARLGDQTQCNKAAAPKDNTAPKDKTAPPKYWGATVAKKAGPDGVIHGDNYDARVLGAYASLEDKTGTGRHDTANIGFTLQDLVLGNMKSNSFVRGEIRTKLASANASSTLYRNEKDIIIINNNASATGAQYGATGAIGTEGRIYASAGGDFTLATAEAKMNAEVYTGNKGRYGFVYESGSEAALAKAEVFSKADLYGIMTSESKFGVPLGGAGVSAGLTLLADTTDYSLNVKISGEIAVKLGLSADINVKFNGKQFYEKFGEMHARMLVSAVEFITDKKFQKLHKVSGGNGCIISGCNTVFIGD
ncbi:PAAR domain-containing protein [Cronobacter dublinensis]|uniref:PAAR domain-containing protein n=1 Tax=Cronobacter dublinensis TaxID=413497 RepID=UPI000CFDC0D2|nr:PAAR domain-containing protein [Cronobacter dublinensis]